MRVRLNRCVRGYEQQDRIEAYACRIAGQYFRVHSGELRTADLAVTLDPRSQSQQESCAFEELKERTR